MFRSCTPRRPDLRLALLAGLLAACSPSGSDPTLVFASATSVEGADNDVLVAVFSDEVIEGQVVLGTSWVVQNPPGTYLDMKKAEVTYDKQTNTATAVLGPQTPGSVDNGNNLQTFEDAVIGFSGLQVPGGAAFNAEMTAPVTGDDVPPSVLGVFADGVATTAAVRFSEPCSEVLFVDLYTGMPGDPGPRFVLMDQDGLRATPATGTVTLTALPFDGDTVVIDDATQVVTFEFDDDGSVVETPTLRQVVIGVDTAATIVDFADAVNDLAFAFDITGVANVDTCDLTHDVPGAAGNLPITETGSAVLVTGMEGGADFTNTVLPLGPGYAWDLEELGVTLDYAPAVPQLGADTVEIYGLRDLAGNQALAIAAAPVVLADTTEPALAPGQSSLNVISGERNDLIMVRFDRPMTPFTAVQPDNYRADPLDLSAASFLFDGVDLVTIRLDAGGASDIQFGTSYDLTLDASATNVLTSAQGAPMMVDGIELIAAGGDGTPIVQPTSAAYVGDAANPSSCVVVFNEAAEAVGATTALNYTIAAVSPTDAVQLTPRAFRLTFAAAPVATDVLTILPAGATDLGGNVPPGPIALILGAVDATPPTVAVQAFTIENAGGDFLDLIYDEPVDQASALDLLSYAVTQDLLPLDLTGSTLRYDSTGATVRLSLPDTLDLTTGASIAVTVTGVTDLSGNVLVAQPPAVAAAGDTTPPAFAGAFVNWSEDDTGQTVEVQFSEDVQQAFVEDPLNWSASALTIVSAVEARGGSVAWVTTVGTVMPGESLMVTGLPDLAGNVSGALAVVPLQ